MKKFLAALALVLASPAFAHDNCGAHRPTLKADYRFEDVLIRGEFFPGGGNIDIPTAVMWNPSDYNEGFKVPIYFTPDPDHCANLFEITVEYDESIFNFAGAAQGEAWNGLTTDSWGFNNNVVPTGYCGTGDVLIIAVIVGNECIPDGEHVLFNLHFTLDEDIADVNWGNWNSATSFLIMCAQADQYGDTYTETGYALHDIPPGQPGYTQCGVYWGTGVTAYYTGCWVFDKKENTIGDLWCSLSTVGDECLSCPGCNYWGECYTEPQRCHTEADCATICESGACKPDAPGALPSTWQKVKGLYRD